MSKRADWQSDQDFGREAAALWLAVSGLAATKFSLVAAAIETLTEGKNIGETRATTTVGPGCVSRLRRRRLEIALLLISVVTVALGAANLTGQASASATGRSTATTVAKAGQGVAPGFSQLQLCAHSLSGPFRRRAARLHWAI